MTQLKLTDRKCLQFIHVQIYTVLYPNAFFVYVYQHMENIFVWKSKLHITRVYEYTTFHMSFTTPYTPHLFIQVWCKQRVDLVPVFWHYNYCIKVFLTIYFSEFLSNWKIYVQVTIIFLSGAFKAEKYSKIHMRYPFLWYSILADPDIRHQLQFYCSILNTHVYSSRIDVNIHVAS